MFNKLREDGSCNLAQQDLSAQLEQLILKFHKVIILNNNHQLMQQHSVQTVSIVQKVQSAQR